MQFPFMEMSFWCRDYVYDQLELREFLQMICVSKQIRDVMKYSMYVIGNFDWYSLQ